MNQDPRGRLLELDRCLASCPDFPGADLLWAQTAIDLPGADMTLARRRLLRHLELYPFDFPAVLHGVEMLRRMGDSEAAIDVAERAAAEARRLGNDAALRSLLLAGAKGGALGGDERPAP
jgi:hypothetical protein